MVDSITLTFDRLLRFAAGACVALYMGASVLSRAYVMPTSKIEEGQVVERGDSVITVVIPDIR